MSAGAETLLKALHHALALLRHEPGMTKLKAVEKAAQEFDLGPLDEEWLLNHLTDDKRAG
jgi:hypothetical protein